MIFKRPFLVIITGIISVSAGIFDLVEAKVESKNLDLKDKSGKALALPLWSKNTASVFVFAGIECPISNRYIPLLNKMNEKYRKNKIQFFEVYSAPRLDLAQINKHASDFGIKATVIWDYKQNLADATGANTTPQVVVVGNDGEIKYSGRIDNQYVSLGKSRNSATTHELDDALQSVVKGVKVKLPKTNVVGCCIPKP